jgi:hypothetical protein
MDPPASPHNAVSLGFRTAFVKKAISAFSQAYFELSNTDCNRLQPAIFSTAHPFGPETV